MPETVGGVPIHPIVVHAVVVLVPLAAVGVLSISVVSSWRGRFGGLVAFVAVLGALLTPVAIQSGRLLRDIVGSDDDIARHGDLGETLIYSVIPLALVALVLWRLGRRDDRGESTSRALVRVVAVVGVLLALGVGTQVAIIGHSGADAAWGTSS